MRFGDKVRTLRLQQNLTQVALAKEIAQTPSTIQSYENNRSRPKTVAAYRRLADALGTTVHYLMTDDAEHVSAETNGRALREACGALRRVTTLLNSGRLNPEDRRRLTDEIEALYLLSRK